jgi:sRNA-binding regulator protein Hfq
MNESTPKYRATLTRRSTAAPVPSDLGERLAQIKEQAVQPPLTPAAPSQPQPQPQPQPAMPPGKAKAETAKEVKPDPHYLQRDFFAAARGKSITVRLLDGEVINGQFMAADQFTFSITDSTGPLLIFKHGCACMRILPEPKP